MRRPPALILKQPNAADRLVLAQIEPVLRAARYIDQITRLDLNGEHGAIFRMNMKHAAAADGEPYFILRVRMLLAEPGQHRVEVRRRWRDVDHVGGDEAACFAQSLDLRRVSRENVLVRGLGADTALDIPVLVPDAERLQELTDFLWIGNLAVLVLDADAGHGIVSIQKRKAESVKPRFPISAFGSPLSAFF